MAVRLDSNRVAFTAQSHRH